MNKTRESLHSARDSVAKILGRRRPTTEAELDECVESLEELKRALPRASDPTSALVMKASIDEIVSRLKNRTRKEPHT